MAHYKMETNSHFTFSQRITLIDDNIIIIEKLLFDTQLVNRRRQMNWGNKWGCYTQRQSYSKWIPLAKINWGNKLGQYTQRENFSKLSPIAESSWGNKWGCYIKDKASIR